MSLLSFSFIKFVINQKQLFVFTSLNIGSTECKAEMAMYFQQVSQNICLFLSQGIDQQNNSFPLLIIRSYINFISIHTQLRHFALLVILSNNKIDRMETTIKYSYKPKSLVNNLLTQKQNRIRISPAKNRESLLTRNSLKPFSSSVIQQKKRLPTKQDIIKMNSKLELIKSKCMKTPINLLRSDSKKTLKSIWMSNEQMNDSVDMDSQDDTNISKDKNAPQPYIFKSRFQDRPSTIYFHYSKCCGKQKIQSDRIVPLQKNNNLTYKIAGSEYKCIVNSLQQNGFVKVQNGNQWNVFFDVSGTHLKVLESMKKFQKINHFPGCWNLGRKDYMWKHLNKQRRSYPEEYNFVPLTYLFPSDFDRFQMARQNSDKNKLWIMKPSNQACGRGIKMVTKQTKIKNKKDYQVSEYIHNPHLINNFKYDLRIYILVTSYDPLRVYMYEEGLTRFATYQYTTKLKDIKKRFIHLTNFSVNKHSKNFVKNKKQEKDGEGSKWSLTALRKYYESIGIDSKKLFSQINDVIIKTCISAEPVMLDIYSKTQEKRNCGFELYGFDILIDSNLKPWLMQVNVCPSLSSSSPMDRKIKHALLADTLNLIGIQPPQKKQKESDKKKDNNRLFARQDRKYFSKNINNLQFLNYDTSIQILSPQDWQLLFEAQEELDRMGQYKRIFPTKQNAQKYKKLFEFNRYNNNMLWKYVKSEKCFLDRLYQ